MRSHKHSVFVAMLAGGLFAGALFAADDQPAASVVGPEDTVNIFALNCEEISKAWRVSATGELNLPLVGTVQASGMSVPDLQRELVRRLKKYLVDPEVSVFVAEVRSRPVTITGAVVRPGVYQLEGHKSLFDAVVAAGGPNNAGTKLTIKRELKEGKLNLTGSHLSGDGSYVSAEVDLADVMKGKGEIAGVEVQARDQIAVAPAGPAKFVHVSGEVMRPGAVELATQDSVSLLKVLAVAGGLGPTANGKKALILHINAAGVETSSSTIDVTKIQSGKARDVELIAGDVVVVPSSALKSYARQAGGSALSVGMYSAFYLLARF